MHHPTLESLPPPAARFPSFSHLIASSAGVDQSLLGSLCFCFPVLPVTPDQTNNDGPVDRTLPDYTGPELSEKTFELQAVSGSPPPPPSQRQQQTASAPRSVPRSVPTAGSYLVQPPPYYPATGKPAKGFHPPPSVPQPKPLRLVRLSRKRKPPVLYESSSKTFIQSLTTLTFSQPKTPLSPPPSYHDDADRGNVQAHHLTLRKRPTPNMASVNPTMPKVSTSSPPLPPSGLFQAGAGGGGRPAASSKADLLADLRRQLDDSASDAASSVDSRGRRRRRSRNNNKALAAKGQAGLQGPGIMPRLAETKPVRLQLGLNLDVELELKARLQGDVSLTLLVESKTPKKRSSTELGMPAQGSAVDVHEMFFMRIGVLRLRRRWIDGLGHDVSGLGAKGTTSVVAVVLGVGFAVGFLAGRWC
ncbi:hypothetical protein D7B24_000089 [Verticillium nonalfalfae]|uniref:Uncharacterized protein n=1 Tax=Verticillium nonalfalfae TaxID=1051616 RepID=A0A3M9YN99_9PEZI|nr:uncharacterized protein D7B24_000089 [Verticillium nonalfalfae]RNJ61236.1 hypothetical protein D7B24_000089 [Verticillium nonalfalfae]